MDFHWSFDTLLLESRRYLKELSSSELDNLRFRGTMADGTRPKYLYGPFPKNTVMRDWIAHAHHLKSIWGIGHGHGDFRAVRSAGSGQDVYLGYYFRARNIPAHQELGLEDNKLYFISPNAGLNNIVDSPKDNKKDNIKTDVERSLKQSDGYRLAEYSAKIREAQNQLDAAYIQLNTLKTNKDNFTNEVKEVNLLLWSTDELRRKEGKKRQRLLTQKQESFSQIPALERQVNDLSSKIQSWMKVVGEVQSASPDEPEPALTSRQRRISALLSKVSKDELRDMLDRKEGMGATRDEVAAYLASQHPDLGNITSNDISNLIKHYGLIIPRGRIPGKR